MQPAGSPKCTNATSNDTIEFKAPTTLTTITPNAPSTYGHHPTPAGQGSIWSYDAQDNPTSSLTLPSTPIASARFNNESQHDRYNQYDQCDSGDAGYPNGLVDRRAHRHGDCDATNLKAPLTIAIDACLNNFGIEDGQQHKESNDDTKVDGDNNAENNCIETNKLGYHNRTDHGNDVQDCCDGRKSTAIRSGLFQSGMEETPALTLPLLPIATLSQMHDKTLQPHDLVQLPTNIITIPSAIVPPHHTIQPNVYGSARSNTLQQFLSGDLTPQDLANTINTSSSDEYQPSAPLKRRRGRQPQSVQQPQLQPELQALSEQQPPDLHQPFPDLTQPSILDDLTFFHLSPLPSLDSIDQWSQLTQPPCARLTLPRYKAQYHTDGSYGPTVTYDFDLELCKRDLLIAQRHLQLSTSQVNPRLELLSAAHDYNALKSGVIERSELAARIALVQIEDEDKEESKSSKSFSPIVSTIFESGPLSHQLLTQYRQQHSIGANTQYLTMVKQHQHLQSLAIRNHAELTDLKAYLHQLCQDFQEITRLHHVIKTHNSLMLLQQPTHLHFDDLFILNTHQDQQLGNSVMIPSATSDGDSKSRIDSGEIPITPFTDWPRCQVWFESNPQESNSGGELDQAVDKSSKLIQSTEVEMLPMVLASGSNDSFIPHPPAKGRWAGHISKAAIRAAARAQKEAQLSELGLPTSTIPPTDSYYGDGDDDVVTPKEPFVGRDGSSIAAATSTITPITSTPITISSLSSDQLTPEKTGRRPTRVLGPIPPDDNKTGQKPITPVLLKRRGRWSEEVESKMDGGKDKNEDDSHDSEDDATECNRQEAIAANDHRFTHFLTYRPFKQPSLDSPYPLVSITGFPDAQIYDFNNGSQGSHNAYDSRIGQIPTVNSVEWSIGPQTRFPDRTNVRHIALHHNNNDPTERFSVGSDGLIRLRFAVPTPKRIGGGGAGE